MSQYAWLLVPIKPALEPVCWRLYIAPSLSLRTPEGSKTWTIAPDLVKYLGEAHCLAQTRENCIRNDVIEQTLLLSPLHSLFERMAGVGPVESYDADKAAHTA